MKTLDLRLFHLDATEHKKLGSLAAMKRWHDFDKLSSTVAAKVAKSFDSVILYHGTRLPDANLVRDDGLKLMTANDLAELAAPLWRRSVLQIREALENGPHFSNPLLPRSLCLEPDRQVMYDSSTNRFVMGGSEALRAIADHDEYDLLLNWKPYVVIVNLPARIAGRDYIRNILKSHMPELFTSSEPFPMAFCYNSFENIPAEHIFDVVDYEEFSSKFPISITLEKRPSV
ncbi:hypothetical protein [Oligoflexus tunisiensis]|uniref:hypothetical protein n=1 Tax=Oligoflexus tunisiensis TaxID=708132 RepID=UPI00114CF5E1|nr:hypothetical protein [Oligoflexus tunisiensis]